MNFNPHPFLKKVRKQITIERVVFICLIVFLMQLSRCNNSKYQNQLADSQSKIDSLTLANQKLDSIRNKDGQTILVQTAIVTTNQEAIKNLTDSIFNLKKRDEKRIKNVIAYYSNLTSTGIDTTYIPYVDSVATKKFSDSLEKICAEVIEFYRDSSVQIPKLVKDSTKDYVFDGTVLKDSFRVNRIAFPDTLDVRIVETKGGFFRRNINGKLKFHIKKSIEVQTKHTNPYVSTKKMNSVYYQPKKPNRFLGYLATFIIGGVGGIYLTK